MRRFFFDSRLMMLAGILTLLAVACGGDGDGDTADTGQAPAETAAPEETTPAEEMDTEEPAAEETTPAEDGGETAAATIAVTSSDLGDILVDGEGMTLYAFLPDDGGAPTCTDDCLQAWPLLEAPAEAGEGVDGSLLGTAEHPSGATQATYGDWPLYYFANDQAPGDTNGQGVGDNWYVVGADGEPVRETADAAGSGY